MRRPAQSRCLFGFRAATALAALIVASALRAAAADPVLSASRLGNDQIELSWTGPALLETAAAFGPNTVWLPSPETVTSVGDLHTVRLSPSSTSRFFRLRADPLGRIESVSPATGEAGVSVNRETIVRFSEPLGADAMIDTTRFRAEFGGRRLLARTQLSGDRLTATLFFLEDLPGSARVQVRFDGAGLTDTRGRGFDADGDGNPGGVFSTFFDTASVSGTADTAIIGTVYASERAADGSDRPLSGVTITVDGAEETLRTTTDSRGQFRLQPAPVGRFFVHVDGRTAPASQWPDGAYYPFIGKAWVTAAGKTNNLAGGTGTIYLPLIQADALRPVSASQPTVIGVSGSVIATNPAFAQVSVTVPANALFDNNGNRGGRVGIAPVPPDRLPEPLPPGLEMALVITVQTDGAANFDQPVAICFPNVADPVTHQPLPPGSHQALISFNHDKGYWEAVGTMTVSADGRLVCSDPGSGIRQPGWHGVGPSPRTPPPPPNPPGPPPPGPPPDPPPCPGGGDPECACDAPKPDPDAMQACLDAIVKNFEQPCRKAAHVAYNERVKICLQNFKDGLFPFAEYQDCLKVAKEQLKEALKQCTGQAILQKRTCIKCNSLPGPSLASTIDLREAPRSLHAAAPPATDNVALLFEQHDELNELLDRDPPVSPAEFGTRIETLLATADTLALGDVRQFLLDSAADDQRAANLLPGVKTFVLGNAPDRAVKFAAEIHRPGGLFTLRGDTRPMGQYELFIPRDGLLLRVMFYDPVSRRYGEIQPDRRPEALYPLPRFYLPPDDPADRPDTDADGLPDVVETVYGTNPLRRDSDGDGIPDGTEVDQGTDPLDGVPARTGILSTIRTLGPALDVTAYNDVAVVAEGAAGVSVFDTRNFFNPVRAAQVDTPGFANAVASDGQIAAVADGPSGLAVIDVANPGSATRVRQVALGGNAVAVGLHRGSAFVGLLNGTVCEVDLSSGAVLDRVNIPAANTLFDLLALGKYLGVLTDGKLHVIPLDAGPLRVGSSVAVPGIFGAGIRRQRLTGGNGLLYATHLAGFDVFGLSPAGLPELIRAFDTSQRGWKQIVPNGSGLGIAAVGTASNADGDHDLYLHDLGPRGTNGVFLTTLATPGIAGAVAIYNGLAYVADGEAGLHVVNYLAADTRGQAPELRLTASFTLTPEARAESGAWVEVGAEVSDDVQVRNVEFFVDGTRVTTDGNFPFSIRWVAPLLSANRKQFTLQARATDTGGNSSMTDLVTVTLAEDATPPEVRRVSPDSGGRTVAQVKAFFSEILANASINAQSFQIVEAGPDGIIGTADDVPLTGAQITFDRESLAATAHFANPLPFGIYRGTLTTGLTDVAGNHLAAPFTWDFRVADANVWKGGPGGLWSEPGNWADGVLPGPADRILIGSLDGETVTWRNAQLVVREVLAFSPWDLENCDLSVSGEFFGTKNIRVIGGRLVAGSVLLTPGVVLSAQGNALLENLTVKGTLTGVAFDRFRLKGGLTLDGTLRLPSSSIDIVDSLTLDGGNTVFSTVGGFSVITVPAGITFTLGSNAVLSGGAGYVQGDGSVRNRGTLRADLNGQSLTLRTKTLEHLGIAEARNGGTLAIQGAWGGGGSVDPGSGIVDLGGSFGPTAGLWKRTGNGSVQISGVLDLAGQSLVLDAATGAWSTVGGTLRNGTVDLRDGVVLTARGNALLENLTVKGSLAGVAFDRFRLKGGLTLDGTLRLPSASIDIVDSLTLDGGNTVFSAAGGFGVITVPAGVTFTLGPTAVLSGGAGYVQGDGSVRNRGTIRADLANQTLTLRTKTLEHLGIAEARNGGTLAIQGAWSGGGSVDPISGVVDLGGSFGPTAGLWKRTGNGTLQVSGVLDLAGQTLVLDAATGAWSTVGGTLRNGTVDLRDGVVLTARGNALLENLTVKGSLAGVAFDRFRLKGGLTLDGTLRLPSASIDIVDSLTLDGGNTVFSAAGGFGVITVPTGVTFTLGPNAVLSGGAGYVQGDGSVRNRGTLRADLNGQSLTLRTKTLEHLGVAEAGNGGTLAIQGAWSGGGSVDPISGVVDLGGSFGPTAGLWKRTGNGTLQVSGVLDLAGQTLVLNAATGAWSVIGGTFRNGTVDLRDGVVLTARGNALLENLTVKGTLTGVAFDRFRLKGGLTLDGTLRLPSASIDIVDSLTLDGGNTVFSAAGGFGVITVPTGVTFTLGPNAVLSGGAGYVQGDGSVRNRGTVRADLAGQSLTLRTKTLEHLGIAEAGNGGTLAIQGAWSGGGSVDPGSGIVDLGGTFGPAAGLWKRTGNGTLRVSGVLDLAGHTLLLDAATGGWTAAGGTLRNGTVDLRDGVVLTASANALLENLTVKGTLTGVPFDRFRLEGGLTLDGTLRLPSCYLDIVDSLTLDGGTTAFSAAGTFGVITVPAGVTFTLGPNAVLSGGAGFVQGDGSVRNRGTIRADLNGQSITIRPGSFANEGQLEQINGGQLVAPGFGG